MTSEYKPLQQGQIQILKIPVEFQRCGTVMGLPCLLLLLTSTAVQQIPRKLMIENFMGMDVRKKFLP